MIGVIASPSDYLAISEFFELFKTPWEICQSDRRYDVLLCAGNCEPDEKRAPLILVYSGRECSFDVLRDLTIASSARGNRTLCHQRGRIPLYGDSVTFRGDGFSEVVDATSGEAAIQHVPAQGSSTLRIGYDLFREVEHLLTAGQPAVNASTPTLDLHISLLRDLIISRGIPLVEIPPVPEGYQFIACLTHDVDHPSIRCHKFDHTMFGFALRAIFGSVRNLLRGRMPVRSLLKNWIAVAKLPFVHMGLAEDFWKDFDSYGSLETGLGSTFFVIPFKGRPGRKDGGPAPKWRAAQYGLADIAGEITKLEFRGCEIGLHGIDAWIDSGSGREELSEICAMTETSKIGTRMHWLYFNEQSPVMLEKAGADYDSTVGYNETVGYRAGTTQVYKPLNATTLLELPLHIMDTALFFPDYLDLSATDARSLVGSIIDNAVALGGTVTLNWHDRSLAPERQWDDFYRTLIDDLKVRGAWFPTGLQAVSWFRKRRSAAFRNVTSDAAAVSFSAGDSEELPPLRLRIYEGASPEATGARLNSANAFRDVTLIQNTPIGFSDSHGKGLLLQ